MEPSKKQNNMNNMNNTNDINDINNINDINDANYIIEHTLSLLNKAATYIKTTGRTIDKYTFLAECITQYNSTDTDKNVLYEPDILHDAEQMYLLYINNEHKYTCKCLLTIFEYLVKNDIQEWEIIEC